jgi:hypothetical protein
MNSPINTGNLILYSYSIEGAANLLREADQICKLQAAQDVVDEYSQWDPEQPFTHTNMTYAVQRFLDTVIFYSELNYRTEFTPQLTVTQSP